MKKTTRIILRVVGAMAVLIIGFLINGAVVESMGPGFLPNFIIIVAVTLTLYIAGFFSLLMGGKQQRQQNEQTEVEIKNIEDKSKDKK